MLTGGDAQAGGDCSTKKSACKTARAVAEVEATGKADEEKKAFKSACGNCYLTPSGARGVPCSACQLARRQVRPR